jgi:hypothetical protein
MSRQRERIKKILDWEELEKAPNTHGAFSFLRSAAEIISIRRNDVPPEIADQQMGAPLSDKTTIVAAPTTVAAQPVKAARSRPYKIHRCTLVQHGQSLGETTLYQALWAHGKVETAETKIVTAGWRTMKRICGMTDKNCKRNTASLIEKLAIEEIGKENVHARTGRTYRVFSFTKTLERRKAAGMEWAVWDKGRRFVQSDGSPLELNFSSGDKTTTVVAPTPVEIATVDKTTPGTVVNITPGTVVKTTPVLGSTLGREKKNESSSTTNDLVLILDALGDESLAVDEGAALLILNSCRNVCPDAAVNEIVSIIREKGAVMRSLRDVRNPIGFLLASVSAVFDGEGIKSYRRRQVAATVLVEQRNQEESRKQREMYEWFLSERDRLTMLIQNPDASAKRRDDARRGLSDVQSALSSYAEEEA